MSKEFQSQLTFPVNNKNSTKIRNLGADTVWSVNEGIVSGNLWKPLETGCGGFPAGFRKIVKIAGIFRRIKAKKAPLNLKELAL